MKNSGMEQRKGGSEREGKMKTANIFFYKQETAYEIKECDWSSDVCSSDLQYQ